MAQAVSLQEAEGQAYWYHLDGRGSVAGLTKHHSQSTHNYRYDAYGRVLPAQGNWTNPHNHYTFLGKEWDEHLGLYEFGVRLYDPWVGVWLTQKIRAYPRSSASCFYLQLG
ncbi:MAG: RHS repeat-associated core domain-containing protein [Candidatus Caldarchaeum sp.]